MDKVTQSGRQLGFLLEKLRCACEFPGEWHLYRAAEERLVPSTDGDALLRHPFPRIIIPLAGRKTVCFSEQRKLQVRQLEWGEAIVGMSGTSIAEQWDTPHEMISCVYSDSFIRILYISHRGKEEPPPRPDRLMHVHHSRLPPGPPIRKMLEALTELPLHSPASPCLFRALLLATAEQFEEELLRPGTEREQLLSQILNAFQMRFFYDIMEQDLTTELGISAEKLARLLREETGMSFREYLNFLRLNYAERLLLTTDLSSETIAAQSGFNYANYFIKVFRRRHDISPGAWRKRQSAPAD